MDGALRQVLRPPIEAVRPRCRTPRHHLHRTLHAVVWWHRNGTRWSHRDIATHHEKTTHSLTGVLRLAAVIDWIKRQQALLWCGQDALCRDHALGPG